MPDIHSGPHGAQKGRTAVTLSSAEAAVAIRALEYMAAESSLEERRSTLAPFTADLSSAPLYRLAERLRDRCLEDETRV